MRAKRLLVGIASLVLLVSTSHVLGASSWALHTAAKTGDAAPGITGGTYLDFGLPDIGIAADNRISFRATLNIGGAITTANNEGIWTGPVGFLQLAARKGTVATGTGATYGALSDPIGDFPVDSTLYKSNSTLGEAIFRRTFFSPNGPVLIARAGGAAPGTTVTFGDAGAGAAFPHGVSYLQGAASFYANLTGGGVTTDNNSGIWSFDGTSVNLVARAGDQIPGQAAGVVYGPTVGRPVGTTTPAFIGTLAGPGITPGNDTALFRGTAASMAIQAREGAAAPGAGAGVLFGDLSLAKPSGTDGNTVFRAPLTGSVTPANDSAIYIGASLLAREGNAAPGAGAGVTYAGFQNPLKSGVLAGIAYLANLAGPGVTPDNDDALFGGKSTDPMAMIAREGSQAADLPAGVTYGSFDNIQLGTIPFAPVIYGVSFLATLEGAGVDPSNDVGLFGTLQNGNLVNIAREGSSLPLGPGDLRTVASLAMVPTAAHGDGGAAAMDDLHRIAFRATFTDGTSAVMIAELPEPAAGAAGAMLMAAALARRRPWRLRSGPRGRTNR